MAVRLSVCLSNRSTASTTGQRVCCGAPCGRKISIACCARLAAGASAQQQMRVASRCESTEEAQQRLVALALLVFDPSSVHPMYVAGDIMFSGCPSVCACVRTCVRACVRMDAFYDRIAVGIQFTTTVTFEAIKATSLVKQK